MILKEYEALRVKPNCAECGAQSITLMECVNDRKITTRPLCARCVASAIKTKKITIEYKDGLVNANKTYFIRKMTNEAKAPPREKRDSRETEQIKNKTIDDLTSPKAPMITTITIYEHKSTPRAARISRSRHDKSSLQLHENTDKTSD